MPSRRLNLCVAVLLLILKLSLAWKRHDLLLSHVAGRITAASIPYGGSDGCGNPSRVDAEEEKEKVVDGLSTVDQHGRSADGTASTPNKVPIIDVDAKTSFHDESSLLAGGPGAPLLLDKNGDQPYRQQPPNEDNNDDRSLAGDKKSVVPRVTRLFLSSLIDHHHDDVSRDLREAIATKRDELLLMSSAATTESKNTALKLIHSMAPKIPAIRHSPDVTLRIRATKNDPDPGIAACIVAAAGTVLAEQLGVVDPRQKAEICHTILNDRRFEQVCECMMSGLDEEKEKHLFDSEDWGADIPLVKNDDEMALIFEQGLSLRDCCRAAWGLSVICGEKHNDVAIGPFQVSQLFQALLRRVCCLLRLQFHRLVTSDTSDDDGKMESIDTRLSKSCRQLAENTLLVLWSFSAVRTHRCLELGPFCSCILGSDPLDLRKAYQQNNKSLGANDVIERLAAPSEDENDTYNNKRRDVLVDWLEIHDIVDTVYAFAVEGSQNITEDDHHVFHEICFDRLLQVILEEKRSLVDSDLSSLSSQTNTIESVELGNELPSQGRTVGEDSSSNVLCVEASSLLEIDSALRPETSHPISVSFLRDVHSFSVLDLCVIAWSATELNVSLRNRLTSRILVALASRKQSTLEDLPTWALINAAWAFSTTETDENDSSVGIDILLLGWIVDEIIRRRNLDRMILDEIPANLLSRFVWSIGVVYDRSVDGTRIATRDSSHLVRLVLGIAASDFHLFSIEDQVHYFHRFPFARISLMV
jgi:hypothetical protein